MLLPLLEQDEVDWQTYELLGRLELQRENFGLAGEYFQNIIDLDPKNRIGWLFKGFALSASDSLDLAEKNYRKSLLFLPEDPYLLSFHGLSLSRLGRDEEALSPLRKAAEIDPDNLNAHLYYGLALNTLQRNEECIPPFLQVLRLDSTNLTALTTLGMVYDQLAVYTRSDSLYDYALRHYPENDLLMNNYAYSLAERDVRLEYALELAKKAIEAQPDRGAYLDTIGWIYYKLGKYNLALTYISRSVENRENSAVVVEHLGDVYFKLGDLNQADRYWRQALEMNQDNQELRQKIENN